MCAAKRSEYYCLLNSKKNKNVKIGNKSFERVAMYKYLLMTLRKRKLMHEEIKSSINF